LSSNRTASSSFDTLRPKHENKRLATRLGRVGGLRVHPNDGARGIRAVFVPDFAFKDDVALAAGVAVGHERIHFNVGLGFVQHERGLFLSLELAKANTGAEILPGDVLCEPCFVDVEPEPVGHVVGEDHAPASGGKNISPSVGLCSLKV